MVRSMAATVCLIAAGSFLSAQDREETCAPKACHTSASEAAKAVASHCAKLLADGKKGHLVTLPLDVKIARPCAQPRQRSRRVRGRMWMPSAPPARTAARNAETSVPSTIMIQS